MKHFLTPIILTLGLIGCGFNPSEGDWIPGDFEHQEKTCFDTTHVNIIDDKGGVDTVVTPRPCKGNRDL